MRLAADVNIIGGGRPDFTVADVSVELDSVVKVDVGRAAFFVVQAASSVSCLFRLRTSLKPSSCVGCAA
jgi:hypothetical protein